MKYLPFLILIMTISIQNYAKPLFEPSRSLLVQAVLMVIPQVADREAFGK